jgi:general nucleoside transport system permease protein
MTVGVREAPAPPAPDAVAARWLRADRGRSIIVGVGVPVAAVVAALLLGAVLIAVEGENPVAVYVEVLRGVVVAHDGPRNTMIAATPLALMGIGLGVAYRARVFTIGAEGQYLIGAVAAVAVVTAGGLRDLPGIVLVPLGLVVAAVAGALWSAVSSFLNARFGTSIVISSLLLTYVASAFVQWAIRVGIKEPGAFIPQSRLVEHAELPEVPVLRTHLGFVLAVAVVPLVWVLLARTRAGFRIDVMGNNGSALDANEAPAARITLLVLVLAGALAGLAGFVQVAGVTGRINGEFSSGYGFTAIIVALLGRLHPLGVLVAALALSALTIGFDVAERAYDLPSALVGVLQALIVMFVVAGDALASRRTAT